MAAALNLSLSKYKWQYKDNAAGPDDWLDCVSFPTVIHHELEAAGKIADPFVGENERHIQWVGKKDWCFRTSFPTPADIYNHPNAVLAFDGLDTIATVKLNGVEILKCDNMFIPYRVDVKSLLMPDGADNELHILFESAWRVGRERQEKYGKERSAIRDSGRVQVRKAQYHWGWDWGPQEVTAGPYKDIRLELFDTRVSDLHASSTLSEKLEKAFVSVEFEVEGSGGYDEIEVQLNRPAGSSTTVLEIKKIDAIDTKAQTYKVDFEVADPQLWWPYRYGQQPLYRVTARLQKQGVLIYERSIRFGIREIKLIRRPLKDAPGESFFFQINRRPIYVCGTNWVPAHNQTPKVTRDRYAKWVDLALRNNNDMIRVWGGGYYEDDEFYNLCDRKGVLLWQDLMTACGSYPTHPEFLESVKVEAEAQVKRLRNHPSIALWCGNNEDVMIGEGLGLKFDSNNVTGPWDDTDFPHLIIYLKIWDGIVRKLTPDIAYWPSSPFSFGGKMANDPSTGDIHQWDVWHNKELPYQHFPKIGGRFVSEFGLHGFPDMRTIKVFAPDAKDRYPTSKIMDCHNKSGGAEYKLGKYLWMNFRLPNSMESFVYLSQLMQAEALDYAILHWRRDWKGEGKELNSGALIWQLNDSNPTTSWALVDYYFRPKAAFYSSTRAFSATIIGIARDPVLHFIDNDNPHETDIPTFQIWGSNLSLEEQQVEVRLRMYDIAYRQEIDLGAAAKATYTLKPNQSTEFTMVKCPPAVKETSYIILSASMHSADTGAEIARKVSWPEPYRYLDLPRETEVEIKVDGDWVLLKCGQYPAKGVMVYVDEKSGEEPEWSDNLWDMMPGEMITVEARGLNGREVKVKHLANIYDI
ncbi:hypothetical protein VTN00DRAFT_8950 [Thermoascus crustaceus]|uniref:uncharacterized protein n=1 Tax=Thermoascus crustaceus TaxID=5088 RepID=UPI003744AAE8